MKTTGTILLIAAAALAFFQAPLLLAYVAVIVGSLMVCGNNI